jgi:hypothetical protein
MLYTCTIHSKGVQLISDNYPVHSDFFLLEYQLYHSLLICFQVKWRHYSVETLHDIAQSVTDSSRNNHNIHTATCWRWRMSCEIQWLETIPKAVFKPLSALTTYHHFRADKESPGIVFVKEYCDSMEKEFRLLKTRVVIDSSISSELPRKGLDDMRQGYLYREIWPLCFDNKAITGPKPTVPKPEITIVELFDKTRKCSYCKQTGHEKSRNGKFFVRWCQVTWD